MNLNELRFASAVASTGSFSAAANACFVTQPTLSNAIARLEDELGERIFFRTTRKVTLTPFGTDILPYLNEVLRAHATLKDQARAFSRPVRSLIRVGVSPLIDANVLGLMIEPFRRKHPEMEVVLCEMNLADLERKLGERILDFVFEVGQTKKHSWQSIPLYRDPLFFVPRGGVPPKKVVGRSVRLADIADETFVTVPDACGLALATRALFRSERRTLKEYSGEGVSCQMLAEWVALGIGAAIVPRTKLALWNTPAFPIVDKSGRDVGIVIAAMWPGQGSTAPHVAEFAEHMRCAALAATSTWSSSRPDRAMTRLHEPSLI